MIRLFVWMLVFSIASPIWPIGENPLLGDPFIIVNKQSNELAFIDDGEIKEIFPVATGKTIDLTPEGEFTIIVKAIDPYYRKKDIKGGAPENPLGTRWIGFDALETDGRTYGVHGTNMPSSIGNYVTAGCIRLKNEDVERLFEKIPIGTKIFIVNSSESIEEIANNRNVLY